MTTEAEIETELKAKGLNAPRLTPDMINETISVQTFFHVPDTTTVICALTLRNGFVVMGKSACASPENFDMAVGSKIARDKARAKIWELEGYLLRERLYVSAQMEIPIEVK